MNRAIRCQHGFLRELVACVECDHAETGKPIPPADPSKYDRKQYGASLRVYRCKLCGEPGHSKTTCARRQASAAEQEKAAAQVGVPNPNLKFRPIPAEFAEPAPSRRQA